MGYAAGYILGGLVAPALGWRAAFLLEAAAMLPFALFCAFGPAVDLRGKPGHPGKHKLLLPMSAYKHLYSRVYVVVFNIMAWTCTVS